jgi:predicted NodU family carbamoyl transferase
MVSFGDYFFFFLFVSLPDPYMITHLLLLQRYLREDYYSVSHSECHCSMEHVCSSLYTTQCSIIDIRHDWLARSPSLD